MDCGILLAADGGSRHLAGLGLTPRVIIGDMDSIPADLWRDENDILRIPHPTEKDKSDAELAVEYAFRHNCEKVVLVAVAGGRLAARSIHYLLTQGKPALPENLQKRINPASILKNVQVSGTQAKMKIPELAVALRRRSFIEEVVATISQETALREASRCLQCGTYCYDQPVTETAELTAWDELAN